MPNSLRPVTATAKVEQKNVTWIRRDLTSWLDRYYDIRNVLDGEHAMRRAYERYLPILNPAKVKAKDPVAMARMDEYVKRAVFYNFTFRTQESMIGAIFLREPVLEVDSLLDAVIENADGNGLSFNQVVKQCCEHTLAYGRCGLYVGYPPTDKAATKADIQDGKVRPFIKFYEPWNITNWRTVMSKNSKNLLTMVILREQYDEDVDGFEVRSRIQFRELRLNDAGQMTVTIWRPNHDNDDRYANKDYYLEDDIRDLLDHHYKQHDTYSVTDGKGKPVTEIRFQFIGSKNNDTYFDRPPLLDMSTLNIGHFRNSADHEESTFMLGQPTPWVSGITDDWATNHLKGELALGSRGIIPLPEKGQAGLLEVQPNTLAFEAMKHKEDQAKKAGAKLIEQRNVEKTATESEIDSATDNSVLRDITVNVEKAATNALLWATDFVNGSEPEDGIKYELNDNFDLTGLAAEEQRWLIELGAAKHLARKEIRAVLKRSGMATMDYDEYMEAIKEDLKLEDELVPAIEKEAAETAKQSAEVSNKVALNPPQNNNQNGN